MTFRRPHVIIIKCEKINISDMYIYTVIDVCELQRCNYGKRRACKCLYKEFGANSHFGCFGSFGPFFLIMSISKSKHSNFL